ncbi:outer membrane protein assembly factor BamE [Chitinibacter fontanus]|uniref:Outer membrane protein assembly factor BamE n=1 Tax=Chitinibacter fontanus TaxID=1737446 RepID=A0A7D5Z703_9NEIS|nr:outer membrane protein assembly factor BamE [Chitinibacter fontanus]
MLTVILSSGLLMTGCSVVNFITPYKLDIPQGNELTADQVENLKVGMTPAQVRFVLGTPLLVDPFHQNRWEYVYRDQKAGTVKAQKRFTVFFENNLVTSWQGDVLPEPAARTALKNRASAPAAADDLMRMKADPANPGSKDIEVKPLIDKGF